MREALSSEHKLLKHKCSDLGTPEWRKKKFTEEIQKRQTTLNTIKEKQAELLAQEQNLTQEIDTLNQKLTIANNEIVEAQAIKNKATPDNSEQMQAISALLAIVSSMQVPPQLQPFLLICPR